MASLHNVDDDEPGPEYDAELLTDVSADECTADAPHDENEEYRRIRRLKNAKHAKHRQNMENRAHNPLYQRNLNNAFAAAEDREYRTPIRAIAEAALLVQKLPPNPQVQRLQYLTQRALMQLDGHNPMSSTQNTLSRSECHGDSAQVSCTPGGGFRPGGMTIASTTRTIKSATAMARASSPRMATSTKRCNNLHIHPAAGTMQGLRAKLSPRPAYRTLLRLI
jgi:hypothetical protein